jgi:hypothetical protein
MNSSGYKVVPTVSIEGEDGEEGEASNNNIINREKGDVE